MYDKDLVMQLAYVSFGIMVINLMMQLSDWQYTYSKVGILGKIGETYLSNRNPDSFHFLCQRQCLYAFQPYFFSWLKVLK